MGMLLAFTRERPRTALLPAPRAAMAGGPPDGGTKRRAAASSLPPEEPVATCFRPRHSTTALKARGVIVDLITDERATRYGDIPGRATHTVPSATFAGARSGQRGAHDAAAHARRQAGARAVRPTAAGRGHRLRRLSDHPAGARRLAAPHPDDDP